MLSLNSLKTHNAPPSLMQRYRALGLAEPVLLHTWWEKVSTNASELYRNDMIWLLENMPPDLPHRAWVNLGMNLLERSFPCLKDAQGSEATAYFAKAADHLFWCNKAKQLGKHPAYFAAQVYAFTLQCAHEVSNETAPVLLDSTMLAWIPCDI
jgi:hypothetical protein